MKKLIIVLILISMLLYGCKQIKEKEPLAGEAYEILKEEVTCSGDVPDATCMEYVLVDGICKTQTKADCCGNSICEQGEEDCIDCPACNDYNKCTRDFFSIITNACQHEIIIPCCGNNLCEQGENCDNCLDDCNCKIDLSDYPDFFSGRIYIVVGAKAPAIDVLSGIDIAGALSNTKSALDHEINVSNKNIVIIGNPCDNKWTNEFMPYRRDCNEYIRKDKAIIKLVKTSPKTYAVIVFGYSPAHTRRAATMLKNYKTLDLEGTEMII